MKTAKIINQINRYTLTERLMIVEQILKKIREDNPATAEKSTNNSDKKGILKFAGILTEEEAQVMENAVAESRKIDRNEW